MREGRSERPLFLSGVYDAERFSVVRVARGQEEVSFWRGMEEMEEISLGKVGSGWHVVV